MAHPAAETELVDRGSGIAAADDGLAGALRTGESDRLGALREGSHLENAHRTVPDDGLGFLDDIAVELSGGFADIETLEPVGHGVIGHGLDLGSFGEFGSDDAVDREHQAHALLLGGVHKGLGKLDGGFVNEGVAHVKPHRAVEGIAHCAADEQRIAFTQQVGDDADLVADLFAAEYCDEGTVRILERLAHEAELLLDEEAAYGGQIIGYARGGSMGAVHGAERVGNVDIGIGSELLCEFGIVLLLLGMEAQILKKHYLALLERLDLRLRVFADNVVRENHVNVGQELLKPVRHGLKAHFGNELALGTSEMRAEDDLCAALYKVFDRGESA